jgi:Ca2+-binding RTX toxin-like protein
MATHVIDYIGDTTWTINASGDTWLLAKSGKIDIDGFALSTAFGIAEAASYKNNLIDVAGDISIAAVGQDTVGVFSQGKNTDIVLRASCDIDAYSAVRAQGVGASIENHANLNLVSYGLTVSGEASVIENDASIHASSALAAYGAESKVFNQGTADGTLGVDIHGNGSLFSNFGEVDGSVAAVAMGASGKIVNQGTGRLLGADALDIDFDNGAVTLVNKGVIAGDNYAIFSGKTSADTVINSGVIVGDVQLGAGDDVFNTLKGKFHGDVYGGAGQDVYVIHDGATNCVELANEGIDLVKSTVTVNLGANIESLTLIGKQIAWGVGNGLDNTIAGNSAANSLFGNDGADHLLGGAGNDNLTGGDGADFFIFRAGSDHDTVADFTSNDVIGLDHIQGIDQFDDLAGKIVDNDKGGVDIHLGHGDVITINNYTANQLNAQDFWIVAAA